MKRYIKLTVISAVLLVAVTSFAQNNLNTAGVRLWLERADVIRGPEAFGEDNYYNSYQLGAGSFRAFTANACSNSAGTGTVNGNCTHAVDGTAVWDATASSTLSSFHKNVLSTNLTSHTPAWAFCGQWLNSTISYAGTLYGFSHGENPASGFNCSDYSTHHKTMTVWTSATGTNAGLVWSNPVEVIDSTDGNGGESGQGDCTAIADTVYAYLFCRKPTNTTSIVARATLSSLGGSAGTFTKYDNGWGSQPGLNGADSELTGKVAGTSTPSDHLGSSVSYWKDQNWMMLLNVEDIRFGGIKASFTSLPNLQSNSIAFTTLPTPLFVQEPNSTGGYPYGSNPPHNLYIYPSVVSLVDGSRTWDLTQKTQFLLAYAFVPPHNTLSQRILAMRSVTVTTSGTAQDPQVLVALTTRFDANYNQRYSSTQPLAVGSSSVAQTYAANTFTQIVADPVGYLAQTATSQGQTLTKLVECRSNGSWPGVGHPDRLITSGSCDAVNYDEDTVAGYSYPNKPATGNSVPIFRCSSNANGTHWVSSSSTCEGIGTNEKSLGWAIVK